MRDDGGPRDVRLTSERAGRKLEKNGDVYVNYRTTMYSGSDSTESQKYPQWALNPSTYQNMSNDQVDWAALAQQWIIMKEAGPPPVPTQDAQKVRPKRDVEGGEAPMDVENDKDESSWNQQQQQQQQPPGNEAWTWNAQSQSWGWNNAWAPPTGVPPPVPLKPPLLPTPGNFFNAPPESSNDNATSFPGFNAATPPTNDYTTGYWTSAGSSKQIKPHNRRFSKVNVPRPVQQPLPVPDTTPQPMLDAAKRKQLPAWIREGLEKMERDKLKQIEKEKEKQERDEYKERLKQNEKETMEILKTTMKERQKSKFESDGEFSEEEVQEKKKPIREEPVILTPEEQMLNVRRTMTEILLKVTGREIDVICREELQRHHKKHKASDHRVSAPSGANVTARLGLGMYGGDSESSEDTEDDSHTRDTARDSDSELRDSIKRKKAEFSKTEREIEEKLADVESRKQELAGSRSSTPDTNDNDTQVDAKSQGRKSRQSPRPTATSKGGNNKQRKCSSSSSSSNDGSERQSKRRSRRSSSDSSASRSPKKASNNGSSKQRNRSVSSKSRSRTPPPKRRHSRNDSNSNGNKSNSSSKKSSSRRSRSGSAKRDSASKRSRTKRSRSHSRRSRSRSASYSSRTRRGHSRSRGNRRSRSRSKRRSRSQTRRSSRSYSRSRRSRSRSARRRRSRSSSSGRGKRSRRR